MTAEQKENRAERIAIMVESGITEEAANHYCNSRPDIFGITANEVMF